MQTEIFRPRASPGRSGLASFVMVLGMLAACSDTGPSEADIRGAVHVQLEQMVPPSLVKPLNSEDFVGMQRGKDPVIQEMRILEMGAVRKSFKNKSWPVRVFVKGTCTTIYSELIREFEGEMEFDVHLDPSGQWVARQRF